MLPRRPSPLSHFGILVTLQLFYPSHRPSEVTVAVLPSSATCAGAMSIVIWRISSLMKKALTGRTKSCSKLSSSALIGDAFILIGLVYIFGSEISLIRERGIADIQLFNPKDFSLHNEKLYTFVGLANDLSLT
ncbi:hypothetical protein GGX14DRAFT_593680 [Mycena pura]|uniref:Uncharacterized protein n=1 Tax=Mycena pura TaxID=153505 RepID=A0AAD6UR93_9AGAR|nr:hypothetical protein GGX14DRAFT_593680 [Mycena pura]